jgi:hypothetical protein
MGKALGVNEQSFGNGLRTQEPAYLESALADQSILNLSQQSLHQNHSKDEYHRSKKRGYA